MTFKAGKSVELLRQSPLTTLKASLNDDAYVKKIIGYKFIPGGNPIKLQNNLKIFVVAKTIFVLKDNFFVLVLAKTKFFFVKKPSYKKIFFCLF